MHPPIDPSAAADGARQSLSADDCAARLRRAQRPVALTGAGVSTAAGIPDFRGPNGLYVTRRYDPDKVFDIQHFHRDPRDFYAFTRDLIAVVQDLEPTFTHRFLAAREATGLRVITQNIDPLHRMAGTKDLIAVHGDYGQGHCTTCHREYDYEAMLARLEAAAIPTCDCGGVLKPDVVFFGEAVHALPQAEAAVCMCDLLLVLGSSLAVYPVALLPQLTDAPTIVVNQGAVALAPAPHRYFVEADLDDFFQAVATALERSA